MTINRENRFGSARRQKFRIGDIVWVEHLQCEAVVIGSLRDLTPSKVTNCYGLRFEDGSKSYWHHEDQLTLIEELERRCG